MNTSFIGIAICFVGSFLGALGDKLVHDSYSKEDVKKQHMSKMTLWIFGTILSVVIDPVFTIFALYFTSAALVAPFAGVHILWNLIISNISLKIKTKFHQYMGSFFLICGIALIIIFSEKKVDISSMNDLAILYSQTKVVIYLILTFTTIIILLIICLLPFFFKDIQNNSPYENEKIFYAKKFVTNMYSRSRENSFFQKINPRVKLLGNVFSSKMEKGDSPQHISPRFYNHSLLLVKNNDGHDSLGDNPNFNDRKSIPTSGSSSPIWNDTESGTSIDIDNSSVLSKNGYRKKDLSNHIGSEAEMEELVLSRGGFILLNEIEKNAKMGEKPRNFCLRKNKGTYRSDATVAHLCVNTLFPLNPADKIKKNNIKSSKQGKKRYKEGEKKTYQEREKERDEESGTHRVFSQFCKSDKSMVKHKGDIKWMNLELLNYARSSHPDMQKLKYEKKMKTWKVHCRGEIHHKSGERNHKLKWQNRHRIKNGCNTSSSYIHIESKINHAINDTTEGIILTKVNKKNDNLLSPHNSVKVLKKYLLKKNRKKLKKFTKKKTKFVPYINEHKQYSPRIVDIPHVNAKSNHPDSSEVKNHFCHIDFLKYGDQIDTPTNWKEGESFSLMVYSPTFTVSDGDVGGACTNGSSDKGSIGRLARGGSGRSEKSERNERSRRCERSGRSGRSGRSRRSGRSGRSRRSGRSGRNGRSGRSEQNERGNGVHFPYLVFIASIYSTPPKSDKLRKNEIYYRICCCTLCGMSGGFVNIFSEQIIGVFSRENIHIFQHPFSYILIILTLFCLCNQLFFLNISLSKFSVTSVIPLIMSNIVFFSSLTTIIMQEKESVIQPNNAIFFSLGVLLVILGILYLQYNINRIILRYFKTKNG
ncbi:hypothetical protein, conserved [Plasmodium gonderi]|uniref:Magnesium transporter n=1 Tax=Plasmodium gonderi TaxID=77519 RepID=A0A1Y1JAT4_PLAGO|nr:hypothetical protein, conserved [Plasmodium gonderi]GAW79629.1 hypothetical protein, conserved [Plasmodium gonderi]